MKKETKNYIVKVVIFQGLVFAFWIAFFLFKDRLFG